ncbi:MAG: formylglycine-generating enzyme family protein [Leptolyngbyaceae cyanobacterium RM2_2_4]|nr:formylglycine-generating enzyme family protein [Leptolyngbyaceae cyanobacterium RM2_2_4]
MVAGFGESWATGVWFDEGWQSLVLPEPSTSPASLTPEQLVQRFDTTASVFAKRLAGLMALVPVSLPIVYLLQETVLQDSTPLHVAEVFMSGLIQREDGSSLDEIVQSRRTSNKSYEFVPGVRKLLSSSVSSRVAEAVLNRVSQYIGNKLGRSIYSFTALLMLEQELGEAGETELLQFAQITRESLKHMGSGYAALVEAIEQPIITSPPIVHTSLPTEFPPLQVLKFETAQFINPDVEVTHREYFPPIQTEQFTITTITVESEDEAQSRDLQPFEFTVATISRRKAGFLQRRTEWVIQRRQHRANRFFESLTVSGDVTLEMVAIPKGTFLMGSPEDEPDRQLTESPQHKVTVEPFYIGRFPVTQVQWQAVATQIPQVNRELKPNPSRFQDPARPVEQVSWYDATEFCARLSNHTGRTYRLPTEAEWEYACRAGTTTPFHFGETISPELANYRGTETYNGGPKGEFRQETTPVEHFEVANEWGLSNMHGNVWEWCQDHWHDSYEGAPTDGSAWLSNDKSANRVIRGGSWYINPWYCRSATRDYFYPRDTYFNFGFRVVCSAPRTLP